MHTASAPNRVLNPSKNTFEASAARREHESAHETWPTSKLRIALVERKIIQLRGGADVDTR
jgi:hypothetical protein